VVREELTRIDESDGITIVATGPLTSDALSREILRLSTDPSVAQPEGVAGAPNTQLYFYDSISPIVEADSIDMSRVYMAARYDKGTADYINCPMTKEDYDGFIDALLEAQSVDAKEWENLNYFEGCLPIEEIARRGRDTLRFGPMKPVGLRDPKTGHMPYAVVQLRQENLRADSYNLVGFQNHLKFGEQARILRMIPGLENAKFLRYGQIHRNTYINGPTLLGETLQMKQHPNVIFAGQISGVEGYVESIATGLLAGMTAAALVSHPVRNDGGQEWGTQSDSRPVPPPRATAFGALVNYICHADAKNFQPANITFDLLLPLDEATRRRIRDKKQRHAMVCERALAELQGWLEKSAVSAMPTLKT
jgi:methylenetetrahydrofolate--tRNA-(uracil-5-)-methyltransferase